MNNNSEPTSRFLRACRRLPVDATPIWFMRQAGRYMSEYRAIREKFSLLEMVARPEIAAEVTMQPVHAHQVDAAILFADILLPLPPMGMNLEFVKGVGPQIDNPFRSKEDLKRLKSFDAKTELGHVMEAIKILRKELPKDVALIGFSGAPFTVASYMIEGGPSKEYRHVKSLMYSDPETWHIFMEMVTEVLIDYFVSQIEAGAQAVQMFDSWVGMLSPQDYKQFIQPYSRRMLQAAQATGVPVLHFGTNTTTLLPMMKEAGGDDIGLD
ncbi:MAG: uroporphyrinogen decarboxylase, partial [Chloroflexota bacterium]